MQHMLNDIYSWYGYYRDSGCPNCGLNFATMPPEGNLAHHFMGGCKLPKGIDDTRCWEPSLQQQNRDNLVKWILLVMAVGIVVMLALVATSHGEELPNAAYVQRPTASVQRLFDWSFVAIHASAGALQARDLYLTSVGVSHHCEEASSNLGPRPGNRRLVAVGLAEFAGVVALDAGMKALARHNKLPRWVGVLGGSLGAGVSMYKHTRGGNAWQNTNCL